MPGGGEGNRARSPRTHVHRLERVAVDLHQRTAMRPPRLRLLSKSRAAASAATVRGGGSGGTTVVPRTVAGAEDNQAPRIGDQDDRGPSSPRLRGLVGPQPRRSTVNAQLR